LDGLEIRFHERRVRVNGRVTRLTPTELDLLHYFVTHANSVVPHDKILQAVWGPDYGNEVEYLRVFVNQLRKKIEPDPAHPRYILTEPWLGYRFDMHRDVSAGLAR
jgi:two-component system KDP operon response regulator KdpE